MNELIYKQDAIDAMCLACGHDCDKSKFVYNAPQDEQVIMCPEHYALSTLPSASTELSNNSPKLDNENGELISRQDAIDAINAYLGLSAVSRTIQNMTSIQEILENLPSASPDISTFSDKLWKIAYERGKEEGRKKGEWIEIMDADEFGEPYPCGVRCSECGFCSVNLDNFCPNCGAKMENDL